MTERRHFEIVVRGGARGLARIVDVLALLEVTPKELHSLSEGDEVRIRMIFDGEARLAERCQARLRQLVVVKEVLDRDQPPSVPDA